MDDNKPIDINMDYVDAIMIVDNKGRIVYSVRYNPRFDEDSTENEFDTIINRNFLEVYPSVDVEESSVVKCLKYGIPIYRENQILNDYKGRTINTQNFTLPIMKSGKLLGAIEISKDITKMGENISQKGMENDLNIKGFAGNNKCTAKYTFEDIITQDDEMKANISKAKIVSDSSSSVLVYGETGTGKELFVQSIHNYSSRRKKPFIAQNCAALPETLFESILFGSVKGAFTGAIDKPGLFELANGGTLFLDEINSMPIALQPKLLRVLQDGIVRRVGDSKDREVDVRIVAAMNENPIKALELGQIREDLFYRLNVVSIQLTPLRERKEDISLYIEHFINQYNKRLGKSVHGVTKEVKSLFMIYNWPGNVRELQHVIEASMNIVNEGEIQIKDLPIYLNEKVNKKIDNLVDEKFFYKELEDVTSLDIVMETIEKRMILKALEKSGGNISRAAEILDISRQNLHYKLNKYNIKLA